MLDFLTGAMSSRDQDALAPYAIAVLTAVVAVLQLSKRVWP